MKCSRYFSESHLDMMSWLVTMATLSTAGMGFEALGGLAGSRQLTK